jgi:hypothetical protein
MGGDRQRDLCPELKFADQKRTVDAIKGLSEIAPQHPFIA